ncbi:unnamed protein product [Boreogadus saida]
MVGGGGSLQPPPPPPPPTGQGTRSPAIAPPGTKRCEGESITKLKTIIAKSSSPGKKHFGQKQRRQKSRRRMNTCFRILRTPPQRDQFSPLPAHLVLNHGQRVWNPRSALEALLSDKQGGLSVAIGTIIIRKSVTDRGLGRRALKGFEGNSAPD